MKKVLVPLAQGCEELEAVTIMDLLTRAGVEVISAGLDEKPVTCSRNTVIIPTTSVDKIIDEDFDLIVLPGGLPGADYLRDDDRIIKLIQKQNAANKPVGAICAAPKVLAKAGVLDNKKATSFPDIMTELNLPNTTITDTAIEIDGNIATSRGPGTAMDFALALIKLLLGEEAAKKVHEQMVRDNP